MDSPIVRDRIVKRYHAKSRQPFDLLSEIGRDSVGAVTLIPEDETVTVNEQDNHEPPTTGFALGLYWCA